MSRQISDVQLKAVVRERALAQGATMRLSQAGAETSGELWWPPQPSAGGTTTQLRTRHYGTTRKVLELLLGDLANL